MINDGSLIDNEDGGESDYSQDSKKKGAKKR